jgi:hypothetical protein
LRIIIFLFRKWYLFVQSLRLSALEEEGRRGMKEVEAGGAGEGR